MKLVRSLGLIMLALLSGIPLASPASAQELFHCDWRTPEYPHISSYNLKPEHGGSIDIKTSTQGSCNPTTQPITATATMTLERQSLGFLWLPAITGTPITRSLEGTGATWRRGELMAVLAPCVPGVYRGHLNVTYQLAGGIVFPTSDSATSSAVSIDCKPKRVSMVIDDTGSMGGVIGSVKSALNSYITGQPEDEYTRWNLTTFKDGPTDVGTTEDRDQIVNWVSALTASGGGDCPEDALGGITTGLGTLGTDPDTDKQMLVATDASTHDGDVDGIIARARASHVKVNVLLTGDCDESASITSAQQGGGHRSTKPKAAAKPTATAAATAKGMVTSTLSSRTVLKRIAQETGGRYFYLPDGDTDDFTRALNEIFATFVNPAPTPTATPSAPATPSPSGGATPPPVSAQPSPSVPPGLPVTGQNTVLWVGIGATLLAVGALLAFWTRTRPVRK